MATLEAKIETIRTRNPLQPVPFDLFPEFCQRWIQNCSEDTEAALAQLRNVDQRGNLLDLEPAKEESKVMKQNKTSMKVKLSGSIRSYGQISANCIKLDRGLKSLKEKIDRMELEVKELKAVGIVLKKNSMKFGSPNVMTISQKVTELELLEKELLNVSLKDTEEELIDVTLE